MPTMQVLCQSRWLVEECKPRVQTLQFEMRPTKNAGFDRFYVPGAFKDFKVKHQYICNM